MRRAELERLLLGDRKEEAIAKLEEGCIPEPMSGCWLWLRKESRPRCGYGIFCWGNGTIPAHRASYILFCGPIPDGLFVLHKCDVSLCVNPAHLYAGTQYDNVQDAIKRGRVKKCTGDRHWTRVRRDELQGENSLAARYFDRLSRGDDHWTRKFPERLKRTPGEKHNRAKIRDADAKDIIERGQAGEDFNVLAAEYGLKYGTIWAIVRGKIWKHLRSSAA